MRRKIRQQCNHVQKGRPFGLCALRLHHSTQHETNLGTLSPVRAIQIVLTTALFPCRLTVASRAPIAPPGVLPNLEGLAGACGFEQNVAQPRGVATLKIERVTEYPSLMPGARMRWVQAVVLDLADIEDSLIAQRQALCHDGRLGSHRV